MFTRRRLVRFALAVALVLLAWLLVRMAWRVEEVSGIITADGEPVAEAIVRVKATDVIAVTDLDGRFTLSGFKSDFDIPVAAWAHGYYISGVTVRPWNTKTKIDLSPYTTVDNDEYEWIAPVKTDRSWAQDLAIRAGLTTADRISEVRVFRPLASRIDLACADCHGKTIYDQWVSSAHANGTSNVRLMTMYNGTDVAGKRSPDTRFINHRDYGRVPLPPDDAAPYFGPGFKLDFPTGTGNCAACHAPTAALDAPAGADLNAVQGIDSLGSHCDFCHKMADTVLDPRSGLPFDESPGVMSIDLRRPEDGTQLFFGQFDDVDVGPDTLAPAQDESRICAACHQASFWGTPIYQSYSEWLTSPYASAGVTCQDCHMKPDGQTTNFAPGRGGQDRAPDTIFTHEFPGADDETLLQDAASLELEAARAGEKIQVTVRVTNETAGHHLPTDHPMRNILLIVSAESGGVHLEYLGGQVLPNWAGTGGAEGDYAGKPGKGYAKLLEERWTEVSPSAAYWNATTIIEDTRIPAMATDVTTYEFTSPGRGIEVDVSATLVFRRAFKDLAEQKGWADLDIVMETASISVEP